MRIVCRSILAVALMGLFAACGGSKKSEATTPSAPAEEAAPAEGAASDGTEANPCGDHAPAADEEAPKEEGGW